MIMDEIAAVVGAENIESIQHTELSVRVNLNCFALSVKTLAKISDLADRAGGGSVITIQSVEYPKLQIFF